VVLDARQTEMFKTGMHSSTFLPYHVKSRMSRVENLAILALGVYSQIGAARLFSLHWTTLNFT